MRSAHFILFSAVSAFVLCGLCVEKPTLAYETPAWPVSLVDVAEKAGLRGVSVYGGLDRKRFIIETNGAGVAFLDYDNDGWVDALVLSGTRLEEGARQEKAWPAGEAPTNRLYRNQHDGTFADVTDRAGLRRTGFASSVCVGDYDNDGGLDLFVTYFGRNVLYRNRGDGTFEDVSDRSGVSKVTGRYSMTATAADLDGDGWPDVYVACDSTAAILYRNNRDGTFTDTAMSSGVAYGEFGSAQAGMGLAVGDYDGDGRLDLLKTHFADDVPALYHNLGRGLFEDVAVAAGLGVMNRYVEWGTGMPDLDNDGRPDLLYVTGNVYPEIERQLPQYPHRGPRVVFRNIDGARFEDVTARSGPGPLAVHSSRGAAFGDFDNDGDVDVLIMNMNEPPTLLRNDYAGTNGWIEVKLEGTRSNRAGIGATVVVEAGGRRQARAVVSQASYYSHDDLRAHFGLGAATHADRIEVRWPSGAVDVLKDVEGRRVVTVREGKP